MGWFEAFAREYAAYGYPVLFVGVLLENAGLPVPGETAVLIAGFLASPAGGAHFHILLVIPIAVAAAVIGDNIGFWLGRRWARPRILQGRGFLFLTPRLLQLADGYFDRYGTWTIFFARFITGLRVVGALAAGAAGMPWPRFLAANAGGALAWAVVMSLLGYFFGHSMHLLHRYIGGGGLIILGCVVVLIGLPFLLRRLRTFRPGLWERLFPSQIWQGLLAAVLEVVCVAVLVLTSHRDHRVDRAFKEWLDTIQTPLLNSLAGWGLGVGSLPMVSAVTCLVMIYLRRLGQYRRELLALLWTLVASEGVGLILWAFLRNPDAPAGWPALWPAGFAGLAPIRAFAVFGMASHLLGRFTRLGRNKARILAALFILLAGLSALWTQLQTLTQVLLEYAAGGLVLFGGLWWLEGHATLPPVDPQPPREPGHDDAEGPR
jgi:membrane-associated protein